MNAIFNSLATQQVWQRLAPELAGCQKMRLGAWVRKKFEYRREVELTSALPTRPAALRIYGEDGACQALFFDFDTSKGDKELVESHAWALQILLEDLGVSSIVDISPNGGRHLYVLLSQRLHFDVARELVEAIASRFSTIDPGPHQNVKTGCCRVPGSIHKHGGHQKLLTSWAQIEYQLCKRNDTELVVTGLRAEFADELVGKSPKESAAVQNVIVADCGNQPSGAVSNRLQNLAQTGDYQTAGYPSASEARFAILGAYKNAGADLNYLTRRLEQGTLPGLALLYGNVKRQRYLLPKEFLKVKALPQQKPGQADRIRSVHESDTSQPYNTRRDPQPLKPDSADQEIRSWTTAILNHETQTFPNGLVVRMATRTIAQAAHLSQSTEIEFGCRSLALDSGHSHEAMAKSLKTLETLGWLEKTANARDAAHQFRNADKYRLTIPEQFNETARKSRWHPGKIHALRPAFTELGIPAALCFEAIEMGRANNTKTLMEITGLSGSTIHEATRSLLSFNLITRAENGYLAHPERLAQVAEELGCEEARQLRIAIYQSHRSQWHQWLENWINNHATTPNSADDPDEPPPWLDEPPPT